MNKEKLIEFLQSLREAAMKLEGSTSPATVYDVALIALLEADMVEQVIMPIVEEVADLKKRVMELENKVWELESPRRK